jgi:amidohydrolase
MTEKLLTPFHDWLVELRRHFHQYPELAYREVKTAAKITEVLDGLAVPYQTGVGRTGVIATLDSGRPGRALAMRADMDALPLDEQTEVSYKSRHPGVMHACGHDGHITIALGVIRWLIENGWRENGKGKILFFFQPAEEGGAGAKAMVETGLLEKEKVEAIFAGHMHPELPVGEIALTPGVCNAASDSINIRLTGRGGHGAQPHVCVDPIVAGAYLVTQLQSIISRSISPMESAVLTIGRFHSGTARNIIPQEAILEGTLRTLNPEIKDIVIKCLRGFIKGIEMAHAVTAHLVVEPGYPVLVNDKNIAEFTFSRGKELLGEDRVHVALPRMGAEDFAYFLQRCPGVLIRVGCHDPAVGRAYGLHSPFFNFDERALDVGVRLFTLLLTSYMEKRD